MSAKIKLKSYFIKHLNNGRILTSKELKRYVKQRKLNVDNAYIRNIRDDIIPTLLYKNPVKIKTYQTITVDRLGLLSMDFAFYKKEWKKFNNNYNGFLMINSVVAKKYHAIPMKSRSLKEFENVLEQICKGGIFPVISVILSDRETAITSPNFRKEMNTKYGIKFQFLTRYNKAWSSENAIFHTKKALSMALISNGGKNWVRLLTEVIANHNRKKIEGTSFSPNDININNFYDYLNELHDVKDITMTFNTNSIDSRSIKQNDWIKKLFKFKLGEKVYASKYSLYGRKSFKKRSVEGTYSNKPFLIKRAILRQTRDKKLVPGMYHIK